MTVQWQENALSLEANMQRQKQQNQELNADST
jgi:hypothetical protein